MKCLFQAICFSFLFTIANLTAEISAPAPEPVHVGTAGCFTLGKINKSQTSPGTPTSYSSYLNGDNPKYYVNGVALYPNYPVTAAEYCTFLQQYASNESCWFYSEYYDSAFMTTSEDWVANKQACIYRSGWSPKYSYTVIPGHESDIIDALQSKQIQEDFRRQRQLPSVKDVCDYLNAKFQGDNDTAIAIRANYPNKSFTLKGYNVSPKGLFQVSPWTSSVDLLFKQADNIAAAAIASSNQEGTKILYPWLFGASIHSDVFNRGPQSQITFQFNGSYFVATCNVNEMYLRPYQWSGIQRAVKSFVISEKVLKHIGERLTKAISSNPQ